MASSLTSPSAVAAPPAAPLLPSAAAPPAALVRLTGHLVIALIVLVGIGGATRVMEAGLACPDWPLCYGTLLPGGRMNVQVFLEWFHRLDAFVVGVSLLVLAAAGVRLRGQLPGWFLPASLGALLLVALQGALGALTVTRLLEASTVTAHLVTALALVLLVSAIHQRLAQQASAATAAGPTPPLPRWWLPLVGLAAPPLLLQCLLGGAMASRWAADRCFADGEACRWLLLHRLAAWPAALAVVLVGVASLLLPAAHRSVRGLALAGLALVLAQVGLGVLTLRRQLADPGVTIAHQLVAALLVALIGALLARSLPAGRLASSPVSPSALEVAHG